MATAGGGAWPSEAERTGRGGRREEEVEWRPGEIRTRLRSEGSSLFAFVSGGGSELAAWIVDVHTGTLSKAVANPRAELNYSAYLP